MDSADNRFSGDALRRFVVTNFTQYTHDRCNQFLRAFPLSCSAAVYVCVSFNRVHKRRLHKRVRSRSNPTTANGFKARQSSFIVIAKRNRNASTDRLPRAINACTPSTARASDLRSNPVSSISFLRCLPKAKSTSLRSSSFARAIVALRTIIRPRSRSRSNTITAITCSRCYRRPFRF